jgi:protein TonB
MRMLSLSLFSMLLSAAASAQVQELPAPMPSLVHGLSRDSVGIFTRVDMEASFPGGLNAWKSFLIANTDGEAAAKDLPKKVKRLEQTAYVQFIVCTDGTLCDVRVLNDVLPSVRREAERVIRKSGSWVPAEQNGRKVKAYRRQPITFVITQD